MIAIDRMYIVYDFMCKCVMVALEAINPLFVEGICRITMSNSISYQSRSS